MFSRVFNWLRGSGDYAVTVPAMDGALRPNDDIESADCIANASEPDNVAWHEGAIFFTSGTDLYRLNAKPGATPTLDASFNSEVSCLASDGLGGLCLGLSSDTIVIRGGQFDGLKLIETGDRPVHCVTACTFRSPGELLITLGSRKHLASKWKWDLLEGNKTGSLWAVDLATRKFRCLADHLAYPAGVVALDDHSIVVSESWRHRLIKVQPGNIQQLIGGLPAYPGRISPVNGGFLLCAFAPRRQLVEFLLKEPAYLKRMMSEIPEEHWMAPALRSGLNFGEPLQVGQIRHHGILKPWAPTKSYGLLARMDRNFHFTGSSHSRAGGRRHGITSAIECDGIVIATSKGGDVVVALAAVKEYQ